MSVRLSITLYLILLPCVGFSQIVPMAFWQKRPSSVYKGTSGVCNGKEPGQACSSTTALFVGILSSYHYMTTPSGCDGTTSNPTCNGSTDGAAVRFMWNDKTTDITTVTNYANLTDKDTGDGATASAAISAWSTTDSSAADYCENLVYGGFSDWYLPNKTELAFMYCRSTPAAHTATRPNEDANCATFNAPATGPLNKLTGFYSVTNEDTNTDYYWSSSEKNSGSGYVQSFSSASQSTKTKTTVYYARCIRKY